MKLSPPARRAILISILVFLFWAIVIVLKNWYQISHPGSGSAPSSGSVIRKGHEGDTLHIPEFWKYHRDDAREWAQKGFDDSSWDTIQPGLNLAKVPADCFKGICWFRANITVDSLHANKVYGLDLSHFGASEIYFDGTLIQKYGEVSANKETEVPFQPDYTLYFHSGNVGMHCLAVRYSNQHYLDYYNSIFREAQAGITFEFISHPDLSAATGRVKGLFSRYLVLLFGFFLTLGIIHGLLFLFYRQQKQNLYYSISILSYSLCFFLPYISITTTDPWLSLMVNHLFLIVALIYMLFLIFFLQSIFKPVAYKVTGIISVCLAVITLFIFYFFPDGIWDILLSVYFTFACVEFIRSVINGLMKNLPGSRIIGTGALIFAVFLSLIMVLAVIVGNINLSFDDEGAAWTFLLIVFCLVSLPLSMSIYLAYDFSQTNRSLSRKLAEVETLSAKTIEQEREKQDILSRQKENLEIQVTERTKEVVQQKRVIEEKNKDITDSINYAKRIQDAILPSEEQVKQMLPDSFVLYKPKDIVSGDFYFFAEVDRKVIAAAVDCTGHGVPGAFMSMVGYNHLKRIVNEEKITHTSKILDELHKQVLCSLNRDISKRDSKDGMDVSIVSVDKQKREVQFSGAVRPLYYFDSAGFHEVKGERYSIAGVKEIDGASYASTLILVKEPTVFYLFSDGFVDQFGGKEGKKLMSKNFRELLLSIQSMSMIEQKSFLDNFIEEWKSGREQMDDIMVIGIRLP